MTVTKCAECPFCNFLGECVHPKHTLIVIFLNRIEKTCPIAQGNPFTISFTPIEETKNN